MSLKKILASMLAVVAACSISAGALTLDAAEAANEAAVAEEAVLAAGDTDEVNAVASIDDQYYSSLDKALADAAASTEEVVTINVLKDVQNIPAPTRAGLVFQAANGVKVTGRTYLPTKAYAGKISYIGFDFSETPDWAVCGWGGGEKLEALELVYQNCKFGAKAIGFWGANDNWNFLSLTVENCVFTKDGHQILNIQNGQKTVIKDCVFEACTKSAINLPAKAKDLVLINTDFGAGYVMLSQNLGNYERNLTVENCTFTGPYAIRLHSNLGKNFDYPEQKPTKFNGVKLTNNVVGDDTDVVLLDAGLGNVADYFEANVKTLIFADNATTNNAPVTEMASGYVPAAPAAKIGNTYYTLLTEAISAAQTGDTIDLLGGVVEFTGSYNGIEGSKTLTFANGTMDFTQAGASDSVFFLWGEDLTFNNIKFVKNDVPEAEEKFMCYLINISKADSDVVFNECEFNFGETIYSSYIANNAGGTITFTKCVINECVGSNFVYGGGALFDTCVYNSEEADIIAHNNFPSEIRNSQVVTKRIRIRNVSLTAGVTPTVSITGNSNVKAVVGISYTSAPAAGEENALLFVEAGSTLITENVAGGIIDTNSTGTVVSKADEIKVEFVQVDGDAEGYDLYNINLVGANGEVINRLNSADLTFKFVATPATGAAMDYEIIAVEKITVTPDTTTPNENRFMFNFNGKDAVADTEKTITIAKVKVSGYGDYTFSVDTSVEANATNVVHATTISDNIVDTFVPGGAAGKGTLDLDDSSVGNNIKVPTRTLTINVAFPNVVAKNNALYQDMKVEITGNIDGVQKTETYDLGEDMTADGKYVVKETRLVLNETYNVVVSGAGYRTARYTVTMTDAKTLNFWNNVKDNKVEVEEGKASSATEKNFLAGDIVGDNQINIYDLSAVVSYFATEITDEADFEKYVKYDLNRDGKIDSKDVAYILVSWGE